MEQSGNGLKEQIHLKASSRHWRTLEGVGAGGQGCGGGGGGVKVRWGSDNYQQWRKCALQRLKREVRETFQRKSLIIIIIRYNLIF